MHTVRRRQLIAGLLVVPLFSGLLSGCFAARNGSSSSGSADGARLKVALAFPPSENFSPYGADATLLSRLGVTEGLTELDANGTAVPALAASWKKESDRSWLFTLREAEFQDGTRVTPSAVANALEHAGEAEPVTAALSGVKLMAKPVGGDQVRITTDDPDPALPLRLTSPGLAVLSPKAYGKGERERKGREVSPVGTATGPFELTKTTGATAATLERFDDYWGGRAQASGIDAKFIADGTARTNALRTHDVDIAEAVPVSQAASLDKGSARETATARTTSLQLNTRSGAFKDPGLRAAARKAIDTSALAKDVYEGHADPGEGVFGPALTWAEGKRGKPAGRAEAKRPGGTPITIGTYDNRPELPEVAQVLKQQLQKAGFKVQLEVRESSRIEGDALAGKFDAFVGARNTMLDTGDPVSVLASDYTCDGSYNLAQLCDKKVDAAVRKAEDTADIGKRQDAAAAAETAILGTDAVVPLVHQRIITGVGSSVKGVLLDPYERTLVGAGTRR
ncbi:ABC transporter substrate-binding protein [Streptomyces purpurogeneiscleroticus]|uniref:ABC transporter substrate-binding protein n=1 Tax=Streptomyces purpurogeneiscleroticus TaxID=68259 RepID=UPI001CBEF626|nr:ABC transporter substrate-binding protein [Streptomyces purpurogeneiscleroticus]MBZ4020530.1 ABC transporter substrate-binding protein [Streptomyces purpurogeneiscleroticus]